MSSHAELMSSHQQEAHKSTGERMGEEEEAGEREHEEETAERAVEEREASTGKGKEKGKDKEKSRREREKEREEMIRNLAPSPSRDLALLVEASEKALRLHCVRSLTCQRCCRLLTEAVARGQAAEEEDVLRRRSAEEVACGSEVRDQTLGGVGVVGTGDGVGGTGVGVGGIGVVTADGERVGVVPEKGHEQRRARVGPVPPMVRTASLCASARPTAAETASVRTVACPTLGRHRLPGKTMATE
eukprot:1730708-Rhodomonas_salina.1